MLDYRGVRLQRVDCTYIHTYVSILTDLPSDGLEPSLLPRSVYRWTTRSSGRLTSSTASGESRLFFSKRWRRVDCFTSCTKSSNFSLALSFSSCRVTKTHDCTLLLVRSSSQNIIVKTSRTRTCTQPPTYPLPTHNAHMSPHPSTH